MKPERKVPEIDYAGHPAFSSLIAPTALDEGRINTVTQAIDGAYLDLCAGAVLGPDEVVKRFDRTVTPMIAELEGYVVGALESPSLRQMTLNAILGAARSLRNQALFEHRRRGEARSSDGLPAFLRQNLEQMRRDGYFRYGVNKDLAASVWRQTWWERALLRKRAGMYPGRHCAMPLDPCSPAVDSIRAGLEAGGVLALASAYMGCEMAWLYAALDFSHPGQTWYKGCYADAGVSTAKTVYMHFDADTDIIKAMLYLSDVEPTNGPFRFVRGSHSWSRSPFVFALHKAFDVEQTKCFEMEADGLDYKLGYYRPRFHLVDHRRDVLALPTSFRGTTHFGDDILDGSELSRELLAEEESFLGKAGTMVLFDGSAGIHRGSQVESGERWAVQIAMRAVSSQPGAHRSDGTALRGRLRYQFHRAKGLLARAISG